METNTTQNTNSKKIGMIVYPWVLTIVGTVMMIAVLLLPFTTATKEHKENLLKFPNLMYVEELDMTCKDVVDMSLVDYVRVYDVAANQGYQEDVALASIVIIVIYGVLSLLAVVLAVLKKPMGVIILDALAMMAFWIIRFDFEGRGVVPSGSYNWGVSSWLAYVIGVVVVAGAVWLLVVKIKIKKANKQEKVINR